GLRPFDRVLHLVAVLPRAQGDRAAAASRTPGGTEDGDPARPPLAPATRAPAPRKDTIEVCGSEPLPRSRDSSARDSSLRVAWPGTQRRRAAAQRSLWL